MTTQNDRIEKRAHLRAPRARVWAAISDAGQFGAWFGMRCDAPFVAGTRVTGRIVPTQVDEAIAAQQKAFEGLPCVLFIERVEPMDLFSFRWHPGAEAATDDPDAPTTTVTFRLEDEGDGVLLTVTETGFDKLPAERRARAFADNEGGWEAQMGLIAKYLARVL